MFYKINYNPDHNFMNTTLNKKYLSYFIYNWFLGMELGGEIGSGLGKYML